MLLVGAESAEEVTAAAAVVAGVPVEVQAERVEEVAAVRARRNCRCATQSW